MPLKERTIKMLTTIVSKKRKKSNDNARVQSGYRLIRRSQEWEKAVQNAFKPVVITEPKSAFKYVSGINEVISFQLRGGN
jgi:hypothetical protein